MAILKWLPLVFLFACVSREEINAALFLHEQIPEDVCEARPELKRIGIKRTVKCTPELVDIGACKPDQDTVREFLSYCKPQITRYYGVNEKELEEILKKARVKE